jgi:hypothetical protein
MRWTIIGRGRTGIRQTVFNSGRFFLGLLRGSERFLKNRHAVLVEVEYCHGHELVIVAGLKVTAGREAGSCKPEVDLD